MGLQRVPPPIANLFIAAHRSHTNGPRAPVLSRGVYMARIRNPYRSAFPVQESLPHRIIHPDSPARCFPCSGGCKVETPVFMAVYCRRREGWEEWWGCSFFRRPSFLPFIAPCAAMMSLPPISCSLLSHDDAPYPSIHPAHY